MARQDIAGLLTGMPSKRPDPMGMGGNSEQQRLAFGAERAQGMQRAARGLMGQGPTPAEQLQMAMADLDLSDSADLRKLAQIQQATGDLAGAAQTAARIKQMQEQVKSQELKQSQGAVFSSYVDSTFNNPELTKLAAGGVLTPNNLDSFIKSNN